MKIDLDLSFFDVNVVPTTSSNVIQAIVVLVINSLSGDGLGIYNVLFNIG